LVQQLKIDSGLSTVPLDHHHHLHDHVGIVSLWPGQTTRLHGSAGGIPLSDPTGSSHLLRGRLGWCLQLWFGQRSSDEQTWQKSARLAGTPSVSQATCPKTYYIPYV